MLGCFLLIVDSGMKVSKGSTIAMWGSDFVVRIVET
jgi:hypothetical protein